MKDFRAARRYASAFADWVTKKQGWDRADQELAEIARILAENRKLLHLLTNPTLKLLDKEAILNQIAPGLSSDVLHFLKVLIQHRRFLLFAEIQATFHHLYEKHNGLCEVQLISAVPLLESTRTKITAVLKQKLRSEIRLVTKVQPALRGGWILRWEGQELNLSFQHRFDELRQQLDELTYLDS